MISILLLFSCILNQQIRYEAIGAVDSKDGGVCVFQLEDGEVLMIDYRICKNMAEGDIIGVIRKNKSR